MNNSDISLFASDLAARAIAEYEAFGEYTEVESPLKERIGEYWTFLHQPDLQGSAWSAAFVSYMVHLAGAGPSFPYHFRHSEYFFRTINDRIAESKTAFWGFRPEELSLILPGDLLGMNRDNASPIPYDWAAHETRYESHADVVVGDDGNALLTIGGNVNDQVGTKRFIRNSKNVYVNAACEAQEVFVVIRSFLP